MSCVEVTDDDVDHGYPIGVMQAQVKGAVRGEAIACRHGERTGYTLKSVLGMDRVWRGDSGAGGGPFGVNHWQNYPLFLLYIAKGRLEEDTSELPSRQYLVCRLLL